MVCVSQSLSTRLSMPVVSNAAMHTGQRYSYFSASSVVEFLGHEVVVFLIVLKNLKLFSTAATTGFPFLRVLTDTPRLWVC